MQNNRTPAREPGLEARRFRELGRGIARRHRMRDPIFSLCEEVPLTPPQLHAVLWPGEDGPLAMGELTRRLGITEKTTGVVDRLEGKTCLERVRDQADRRVVLARLTAPGEGVSRRLDRHIQAQLELLLPAHSGADRRALRRIPGALDRPGARGGPPGVPAAFRRGAARPAAGRRARGGRPRSPGPPRTSTARTHPHPREDR